MSEEELFQRFAPRGIVRGGELYLDAPTMQKYIGKAEKLGLAVVGVEGFELHGTGLQPRLDLIADYSGARDTWPEYRLFCNKNAAGWIAEVAERNLIFAATVLTEEEWRRIRATGRL
jgi:hypothetical protein